MSRRTLTPAEREKRRLAVAKSLAKLRAYRKEHDLCRECGEGLALGDITRCRACTIVHGGRETEFYRQGKRYVGKGVAA